MSYRTKFLAALVAGTVSLSGLAGCDLVDPTEVDNPALTEEAVLSTPRPLTGFIAGLERQTGLMLNEFVPIAEIGSDNYQNTQTFFNTSFDNLDIRFQDGDINSLLFDLGRLRELAIFGYTTVREADEDATDNQVAEAYYFEALANVYLGQAFVAAPAEPDGPAAEPSVLLQNAVAGLNTALDLSTDAEKEVGYRLLQARAYYALGDRANARALAQQVIDADPDYVRFARYGIDLGNDFEGAIFDRSTFDDLQPLPRLDFLDPKYNEIVGDDDIAYLKAEEAYLILIEDALAGDDLPRAKSLMNSLIALVDSRPVESFVDQTEGRAGRPNATTIQVRASAADPFFEGLVLDRRAAEVTVPSISGTSVTEETVDGLSNVVDALTVLYLMRQEIFIAEGRRFLDLGIRLPLSENEQVSNPNVDIGPLTTAFIPEPINGIRTLLDAFSVDTANANLITVNLNLNRIIAENRGNDALVPFF